MDAYGDLLTQVTRIADALEILAAAVTMEPEPEPESCQHDWVDLGDEVECRICQLKK
jgi:hypothetical protein